jgi:[NiFe] hydrogenase diaphorase moiety large subunit
MKAAIKKTIEKYGNDKFRLMDVLIDIQQDNGYISREAIAQIAEEYGMSEVDVDQTVSFYHFFSQKPTGKYSIYLNNSAVAIMMGRNEVAATFQKELGIKFGDVTPDGRAGLFETSCIGMNDQEPAAIINNRIFTRLTPFRVKEIVRDIREGKEVGEMFVQDWGDGENRSDLIRSVVSNNIRKIGPVLERNFKAGQAIEKISKMKPEEVIDEVKKSNNGNSAVMLWVIKNIYSVMRMKGNPAHLRIV